MFKELSEDLNSIKKIQTEMEDTLIEIKNNLLINSKLEWMEWMKPRLKSMIWDIRKKKQPRRTTRRKKNTRK